MGNRVAPSRFFWVSTSDDSIGPGDPAEPLASDPPGGPSVRVVAIVATGGRCPVQGVVSQLVDHVHGVVVVHDGSSDGLRRLADFSGDPRIDLVASSVREPCARRAAGLDAALARLPDAVLFVDPDDPPPPDVIPDFVTALSGHDVVVGDRSADRSRLPLLGRLLTWLIAVALVLRLRRSLPDPRCPTRLFRRDAIAAVPPEAIGYRSDAAHLKAMLARGLAVTWVRIPSRARTGLARLASGDRRSLVVRTAVVCAFALACAVAVAVAVA